MDSLTPESAGVEEARIRTVYAERQRNDVRLGFATLAGRRGPSSKLGSNPNQAL